ncbi:MAG: hypothetical protein KDK89_12605 [Alphaproteobacteria bacterium]|nr:hypothetical protein [Alphaproteobacteria bacterium]
MARVVEPRKCNVADYGRLAAAMAWPSLDASLASLVRHEDQANRQWAEVMLRRIASRRRTAAAAMD